MGYKNILVTGGCGFIGSHFIRYFLKNNPKVKIINVDFLTYAGNLENIKDVAKNPRYKFYKTNICDFKKISSIIKKHKIDCVVNFAAESDNNRAVHSPINFARTNAYGTAVLIEAARHHDVKRFHHISTCEVFGQMGFGRKKTFHENSPYQPRTPYNASKAAADHIVKSYFHTHEMPITISYCANNYGTHQFPEKLIPVFIIKALKNEPLPVFASHGNKREWIHVFDHCQAIALILKKGKMGETYNIGTGNERSIMDIATEILTIINKPKNLIQIVPDRPGHDRRYLLNSSKITEKLGWKPKIAWDKGLRDTINWYVENEKWWSPLLEKSHAWKT